MTFIAMLALGIFIVCYLMIVMEHRLHINKSGVALACGAFLWFLVVASGLPKSEIAHAMEIAGAEIFGIVGFLLAAMTLVEILVHYNFFDVIRIKLTKMKLDDRGQFAVMGVLTFFLSAVFDNLTITIIMIQIARRFFSGANLITAAAGIVVLANAGGAWSPIGDVTTIMLWLAGKFGVVDIISHAFLPSLALGGVVMAALLPKIKRDTKDMKAEKIKAFTRGEKLIIGATVGSFALPLFMNLVGLQPYLGLMMGLGVVWLLIDYAKIRSKISSHLEANINHFLEKVDIVSLKFFIGILLSVSALKAMGVLDIVSVWVFGETQTAGSVIFGSIVMGLASAIFDNVPLTAVAIDMIQIADPWLWTLLAITVGTGGSLLVVGSVAGVVAMGMVKELTFARYFNLVFWPALIGYFVAIGVWYLQYMMWA